MDIEQEKRNSSRIQFRRQAKLDFNTKVYEKCLIKNLSLTGMFVNGDFQQNEGDFCEVNLVQEGKHSYLSMDASAQVVRNDDNGIAVVFTAMPLDSLLLLQTILHCEDGAGTLGRGIESLSTLPFKVHDDLLR